MKEQQPTVRAFSAKEIDLDRVAEITNGTLHNQDGRKRVDWPQRRHELGWRTDTFFQKNEDTLVLWRGQWGGPGMENYGLVEGETYIAFVSGLTQTGRIEGEMVTQNGVEAFGGPAEMFSDVFHEARNIARDNFTSKE